ncbi:MAG: DUF4097 domain-containing protein [Coriobacteriales bacterium]|jgi:hypothetical protein|nr:DUF4097 domain-containing protein [Coriobacteriales bacterium]
MSKSVKTLLIIAAMFLVVGGILGSVGYFLGGMKPITLRNDGVIRVGSEPGEIIIVDEQWKRLEKIVIDLPLADLRLEEGDSFSFRGSYDSELMELKIVENNGTLTIRTASGPRQWWSFGLSIHQNDSANFVLTYPKDTEFREVSINNDIGSLRIADLTTEVLTLSLDVGSFTGADITVGVLDADLDLGSCTLSALTIEKGGKFNLDAGSLTLDKMVVHDLDIKSNLGSVECDGIMTGTSSVRMDNGSLSLDLDIAERDLSYEVRTDLGEIRLNGKTLSSPARNSATSPKLELEIRSNLGRVSIQTN